MNTSAFLGLGQVLLSFTVNGFHNKSICIFSGISDIQTHPWVKHLGFEFVHIFSTRLIKTFILKWKQRRIITISEVQGLVEVFFFIAQV